MQVATVLDLVEGDTGAFRSCLAFTPLRLSCYTCRLSLTQVESGEHRVADVCL